MLLKLVHVFAVIIFLGNIITGLVWMKMADKTNELSVISFAMKGIIKLDQWFTVPGVIIITAGGIMAAQKAGFSFIHTGWIFWAIVMFSVSGIVFSWKLVPLQRKILRLTENTDAGKFNRAVYQSSLKQWEAWGLIAILTPLAALVMMLLKVPDHSGL